MDPLRKAIVFLPQRRKGSTQGAQRAMTCSSNVSDSSFRYAPFGMTTIYVNEEAASEAAKPPLMPPLPLKTDVVIPTAKQEESHRNYRSFSVPCPSKGRGCKGLAMTALSFCFALFLLPACQWNTLPPDIWEKEQMTEFLVEAQLVEAKVDAQELPKQQKDSLYTSSYEELFAYYNTTREIWQKNIEYYRDKPEEMDDIYKEVVLRLTLLESTVQHERTERDTLERKLKEFKIRQQD